MEPFTTQDPNPPFGCKIYTRYEQKVSKKWTLVHPNQPYTSDFEITEMGMLAKCPSLPKNPIRPKLAKVLFMVALSMILRTTLLPPPTKNLLGLTETLTPHGELQRTEYLSFLATLVTLLWTVLDLLRREMVMEGRLRSTPETGAAVAAQSWEV